MAIRHHRKLLTDDSTNTTLSELCEFSCDPMNESGFCISPCLSHCPDVCRYNFADRIPPTQNSTLPDYSSPPPETSHHLPPLLMTTFVALALTIVLIGCYLIFVRYFNRYRTRRRSIAQPQQTAPPPDDEEFFDQGPVLDHPIWYIRTVGLQPSAISKITICKYKRGDGLVEGTECSVCLSEFEEDESLRLFPKCSHAFHISCIDTWLRSHTNCPNCRAPIVTNVARSPSPESSANNSMTWEEIRLDDSNPGGGMSSGIENDPRTMGETEVETEESNGNGTGSGNGSIAEEVKTDMQLLRRSVSVDSLSAAKISQAVADFLAGKSDRKSDSNLDSEENQDQEMGIVPKRSSEGGTRFADNGSSSIGSSGSMKRSLSLSGRFSLSKYSRGRGRSRSLVLPL